MTTRIPDVNVLMYAFWDEMPNHRVARAWLEQARRSEEHTLGLLDIVLLGFVRLSTSRRIMRTPVPPSAALEFVDALRGSSSARQLSGTGDTWAHFETFAHNIEARDGDLTDAYLAAVAVSIDGELITFDRGFRRFEGLRFSMPEEM